MANDVSNVNDVGSIISKMSAGFLEDNLQHCKSIDKEPESSFKTQTNGFNHGDTVNINIPARFTSSTGADATSNVQDIVETRVPLQLDTQRHVLVSMTSADIATDLALKSWGKRVLKPMVQGLAHDIEADVLEKNVDAVYNQVGVPGSTAYDTATMMGARKLLNYNLCPLSERKALLNPNAESLAVIARKGQFQSAEAIAKQYKEGYIGRADGFDYMSNAVLPTHTNGNDVTGVAVEADVVTPATGATTLGVDGLTTTTGTVKKGTVFTIAGVNAVHPQTKADLGYLQQFVVTADATANGSGQATLSISPTIYDSTSDGLQNVSALPADEAAIVFEGSASTGYAQSLVYHPSAFRLAFAPLPMFKNGAIEGQETYKGITIRVRQDGDILTDKMYMRLDVLYGRAAVRPEWACRVYD
jgi:hypothetical protein